MKCVVKITCVDPRRPWKTFDPVKKKEDRFGEEVIEDWRPSFIEIESKKLEDTCGYMRRQDKKKKKEERKNQRRNE